MNSKSEKKSNTDPRENVASHINSYNKEVISGKISNPNFEKICDENLTTLEKIHAILKNCVNLSKSQKLEFAESERYFMKLYLKKLNNKLKE